MRTVVWIWRWHCAPPSARSSRCCFDRAHSLAGWRITNGCAPRPRPPASSSIKPRNDRLLSTSRRRPLVRRRPSCAGGRRRNAPAAPSSDDYLASLRRRAQRTARNANIWVRIWWSLAVWSVGVALGLDALFDGVWAFFVHLPYLLLFGPGLIGYYVVRGRFHRVLRRRYLAEGQARDRAAA